MRLAIIGAGLAGLMAAYELRNQPGLTVTVYEKSRGLAGRAATRWFDRPAGRVYVDHGAQYLRDDPQQSPALFALLHDLAATESDERAAITRPVWVLDRDGAIHEGDRTQNTAAKWSYRQGLTTLGKRIATAGALDIKTQVRIDHLHVQPTGSNASRFSLIAADGQPIADADQILLAIPSGQAADLLAASEWPAATVDQRDTLIGTLRQAVYRRCRAVTLGYEQPGVRARLDALPYYALINTDRGHDIVWLAFEQDKPGHVPPGQAVIIAHMSNAFTVRTWDSDPVELASHVAGQVADLLGDDLRQPDWSDTQRWRYSQPDTLLDSATINGQIDGLWFAGDYLRGGRMAFAAQSGADTALLLR